MSSESGQSTAPPESVPPQVERRALAPRLILIGGVVSALIASALLLAVAGAGRIAAQRGGDTVAISSATATLSPSPTPQTGFQVYSDTTDGFVIQYPKSWTVDSTASPVIQFSDDSNETGYVAQVATPADSTLSATNGDPTSATTWVNYELNIFAEKYPQNFILLNSGQTTRVIGGAVWQSGAGLITNNSSGIHLQVYATVYKGKPYLINLLSAQDRFSAGSLEFFDPMLASFAFLETAH
jgi:hypothetical protein